MLCRVVLCCVVLCCVVLCCVVSCCVVSCCDNIFSICHSAVDQGSSEEEEEWCVCFLENEKRKHIAGVCLLVCFFY